MKILHFVGAVPAIVLGGNGAAFPRVARPPEVFTYPAEFEPQSAVWLGALLEQNGQDDLPVLVQMVQALAPHVDLYLVAKDAHERQRLQDAVRNAGVDARRLHWQIVTSSPTRWYRDVGRFS